MYWHPEAAGRAVRDAGLRATVATPLIDVGRTESALQADAMRSLGVRDACGERVDVALAPHAIYTVGERSLRWIAKLAAERDLPVHIHLSEAEQEVIDCLEAHGQRPAAYLDRVGLLGPRTVLAHGVWLDRAELELIAARGATLVTNPVANMKLAVGGVFPYLEARRAGVAVGLGTDGPGSNDSLDLFADMKVFALLQKHEARDAAAVRAGETWEIATGGLAPLLGDGHRLAVGERADFLLLRPDSPELGVGELAAGLVYAAAGSVVDTTVVAGRVLMRHRRGRGGGTRARDGARTATGTAHARGRRAGVVRRTLAALGRRHGRRQLDQGRERRGDRALESGPHRMSHQRRGEAGHAHAVGDAQLPAACLGELLVEPQAHEALGGLGHKAPLWLDGEDLEGRGRTSNGTYGAGRALGDRPVELGATHARVPVRPTRDVGPQRPDPVTRGRRLNRVLELPHREPPSSARGSISRALHSRPHSQRARRRVDGRGGIRSQPISRSLRSALARSLGPRPQRPSSPRPSRA